MTGYVGKTTNQQREVVGQQAQAEREAIYGPIPGEIVDYDAATQTATVKPLMKRRKYDGSDLEMPNLLEVPIEFPRTGNAAITMPLPAGTRVMLNPTMRSSENYDDADDGAPSDMRSFNLSDMRATVAGGDSLSKPLANVDPDNTHFRFDADGNFGVKGSPDGKIAINGAQGNIYDLYTEGFDLCQQMADYLSTEPELIHVGQYANIATQLANIVAKLEAMALE